MDLRSIGRGPAIIRIFLGVIVLANGLAKVFSWPRVSQGDFDIVDLINRPESHRILDSLANEERPGTSQVPGIRSIAYTVVLDNWGRVRG